jgi:two-component system NtrC family sensor kinase
VPFWPVRTPTKAQADKYYDKEGKVCGEIIDLNPLKMKTLNFTLFLALICSFGFAQVLQIDSLPQQGILLDKGWKWHAGDNPDFANADFDDSAWEGIDPTKDIMSLPKLRNSKVSWLRLTLKIDTNLTKKGLALLVWQNGATEMYIDNHRFQQFGHILDSGKTIKATQTWGKATFLPILSKHKKHTIAIRFGFEQDIKYIKWFGWANHALRIIICQENDSDENYFRNEAYISKLLDIFKMGIFIILTILHLTLYFNYKKQKGNLFMGIYTLFAGLAFGTAYCFKTTFDLKSVIIFTWLTAALNVMTIISILELVYYLLTIKKGLFYIVLISLSLAALPVLFYFYDTGWLVIVILMFLVSIEVIRLGIFIKKGISSSQRIIIYGGSISVIFYIIAIVVSSNIDLDFLKHLSYNISYLSLPISFSIFLSFEFATTNKLLEKQLQKIENLSTEKQQILANQNETLEKQVNQRTTELQHSLDKLKSTQAQLIQSEKLASLGELTAGIAHEIQNPLNFVNNFSELSVELLQELQEAKDKGQDPELEAEILGDITQNLEKINHHGKRAASIVKGMLEHSKASTGKKELTDINALVDEYARLAYSNLRSKNEDVTVTLETHFENSLPKIDLIPQDIGRVLLNLINNAFWAVSQHTVGTGHVETGHALSLPSPYQPTVTVSTQQFGNQIIIKIKDNGIGMSKEVQAKVFQPFFTTKPTGQGTGLGLSLAYDIVTKGHGGTLEVESTEGEGSIFIINLPLKTV